MKVVLSAFDNDYRQWRS